MIGQNVEIVIDCDDRFKLDYKIIFKPEFINTKIYNKLNKLNNILPPYSENRNLNEFDNLYANIEDGILYHVFTPIIDIQTLKKYADIIYKPLPYLNLVNDEYNFIRLNGYINNEFLYYKDEIILSMNEFKEHAFQEKNFYTVYLTDGTDINILKEQHIWIKTLYLDKIPITNAHFSLFIDPEN